MSTQVHRPGGVDESRGNSTSPALSSPPKSPVSADDGRASTYDAARTPISYPNLANHEAIKTEGGERSLSATTNAKSKSSSTTPAARKPRKRRETATTQQQHSTAVEVKEKKTRKPRSSSTTANTTNAPTSTSTTKRRSKLEDVIELQSVAKQEPHQPKIADSVPPQQPQSNSTTIRLASVPSQNGINEAITSNEAAQHGPPHSTPRSGQNYDPIRSSTLEASKQLNPFGSSHSSPLKSGNRASASPSIASLIDPPNISPIASFPLQRTNSQPPSAYSTPTPHLSPVVQLHGDPPPKPPAPFSRPPTSQNLLSVQAPSISRPTPPPPPPPQTTEMEIDSGPISAPATKPTSRQPSLPPAPSNPISSAPSPKPRPKEKESSKTPPINLGNGLLPSSLFGGPSESSNFEKSAPTVILHVPLNGETNKYVNFARMAEAQYGFNALHPRLAAQQERLRRVAAAGAALENASKNGSGASADEMSLDLSEGEAEAGGDSNVEMGGMGPGSGMEKAAPKKRRMKEDDYDKDDPFVDDSEMAWEEQAAASKDGFFVYKGPLVPEGEKPVIERPDAPVKRGRGRARGTTSRGGGPGSRGGRGRGTHSTSTPATLAIAANPVKIPSNLSGLSGVGASGSVTGVISGVRGMSGDGVSTRGTGTTRKPRITKAARLAMEREKEERERAMGLAIGGPGGQVLVRKPDGWDAGGAAGLVGGQGVGAGVGSV